MLMMLNNRYKVISQLGQGGMGTVYLVQDTLRDDQVMALKLVRIDAIGERGLAQFKYEFAAMTQLRHPNLVEVYDFGKVINTGDDQVDGLVDQHFFTMQHVPGDDLLSLARQYQEKRPAPDSDYTRLYDIIVQICRALQYLHTRGFIHFDVKPSNVRITPEGIVKLMDFGLISEARVSLQIKARGTPDYIAPEIISGGNVDHRADLYSLGVLLYEVVTGRLPFHDTSSGAILRQHLNTQPELPIDAAAHLPPGLRALIIKLLAKDPANRYQSANQVIQAINEISGQTFEAETKETRQSYIYSASFVGRKFETAFMQGLLMRAMQGQGRMVLVGGVPGIGKMRLVRELKTRAQMQHALVLEGACQEMVRSPYQPWISIFGQLILHYQATASEVLTTQGPALARLIPELGTQFNLKSKETKFDNHQQDLQKIAAQFLLACDQPLVIVLEDLQYADAESIELLSRLGQEALHNRMLLCGIFRTDEVGSDHLLMSLLARSSRADSQAAAQSETQANAEDCPFELLHLEPLNEDEVETFVRSILGMQMDDQQSLPEGLLQRLMSGTGGNPSFIQAVIQNLLEEEQLQFDGKQWTADVTNLSLPASIQEAAQKQLGRLDETSRSLLQWAAILGQWLEIDVLIEVCGLPPEEVMGLVNQAVWQHVLSRREQSDRQVYRFSTDAMRNALYQTLAPEERAHRHQRLLEVLRRLYPEDEIADWLAWHAQQAGDLPALLRYAILAGQRAARMHAHELAVQHFSQALELLAEHPEFYDPTLKYDLLAGREACYGMIGDRTAQAKDLDELESLVQEMGDIPRRIEVATRQTRLANLLGQSPRAMQSSQLIVELARQTGDQRLEAGGLQALGETYYQLGHYEETLNCHKQALKLYVEIGDRYGEAQNLRLGGRACSRLGRLTEAIEYQEKALEIYRELGDPRGEAGALTSLGVIATDYARGRNYHEQALAIRKRIGDRAGQATSYNNLAVIHWSLGLYSRARDYMNQALEIAINQQDRFSLTHYYETLGRILLDLDEYEEAEKVLQEGLRLAAEIGDRWSETLYYFMLGRVALARGQYTKAIELNQKSHEGLLGENAPELASVLAWRGVTHLALGDWQAARARTSEAVEIVDRLHTGGDYPPQDVYWLHYQVLRADPVKKPKAPLDDKSWEALQKARQAVLSGIATLSDEGLRRNYLNKVRINHDILIEWTRQSARRGEAQKVEEAVQPEIEAPAVIETDGNQEKLKRVLDISVQMNETHDDEALFNYVMDQVIELSGAERSFLVLMTPTGQMDFRVARGIALEELEQTKAQISYSVLGEVARSKKAVLLQNAMTDERFGRQSSVLELNLRSVLCVPLITRSELVGMIYADNRSVSGRFSQTDVDLMAIFANQAATALENARMYQELQAWTRTLEDRVAERTRQLEKANLVLSQRALQLEASSRVAQQVTSILVLQELLDQVVMLIQQRFGYYSVTIWLIEGDQRTIKLAAGASRVMHNMDPSLAPALLIDSQSIIASVCRTGANRVVNNITEAADYLSSVYLPATLSEITLPLRMSHQIFGAMDINADYIDAFGEEDVITLQTLADQIAIAIRNAQLYRLEQDRRLLAESLSEAGREITSSLDMAEVPGRILDKLAEVVPYERCSIWQQEGKMLYAVARRGFPESEQDSDMSMPIRPGDVFEQVVAQASPVLVNDVTLLDQGWQQVDWLPVNKSWMGVPLVSKGRVIGMVSLTRRDAGAFSPSDATIASAFAMQAAIALENANLYQQITSFSGQLEHWVEQRTEELNRAYHTLERMDKTKSDFINVAAHELRTPLTVIKGYSQLVKGMPGVGDSAQATELIEGIIGGADRLHLIVNSMLDVSKISSQTLKVHKERISMSEIMKALQAKFEKSLEERCLTLVLEDLEKLPLIEADLELMKDKVFYHLLVNAIKYTPDGGRITISGRLIDDKSGAVDPPTPNAIEVIIKDTGIGIDPANHKMIFEKFFSTGQVALHSSGNIKFKGGGPGLGLAIVSGIVEAHGGRIWVESLGYNEETCPGSAFHIVLRF